MQRKSKAGAAVIRYDGKRGTVWRIKYLDAAGVQVMETVGAERDGVTEKHAAAELRERLVRVDRQGWRKPPPLTFGEYAAKWFAEGAARRRWRPATVRQYRHVQARLVDAFGAIPLAAVRPRDVAAYVAAISADLGASTVNRDLALLHAVYRTAKREELVDQNPAEAAERPRLPRRRWRILEPVEIQRTARAFTDDQARTVFLTLVLTGIRKAELQALRWRDVDLVENVLRVRDSKTEEGIRSIALSPALAEALWQWRRATVYQGDDELVFCNQKTGGMYRANVFKSELDAALKEAGIVEYVRPFHDLRHSSITNDAASGASPIAVMAKAGHRNMSTTRTYLHLAGVVFRDEAAALERRLLGTAEEQVVDE